MRHLSPARAARVGILAIVVGGALADAPLALRTAAADPLVCAAATPAAAAGSSPTADDGAPATPAAIPTQSAIEPETNPPGDIPDNQAFVPFTSVDGGYTISMPEGWARTESGPDVRFADKLHTFSVDAGCAAGAPTVESVTSEEATLLARQVPAFELVDVTRIELPAGPAVLVRYRTNSAPDDVTGKQIRLDVERYELFKDGRLVAISLAVPAGSDNVDVANLVSRSFRWTT